jgi:hypothetical protein
VLSPSSRTRNLAYVEFLMVAFASVAACAEWQSVHFPSAVRVIFAY